MEILEDLTTEELLKMYKDVATLRKEVPNPVWLMQQIQNEVRIRLIISNPANDDYSPKPAA